jgi:predicted Zn-ribbon and HTH transcriptional regulator
MRAAEEMIDKLEAWYDAHPDASFGEIEEQARQERRELMGTVLEVVVNGRDTGVQVEPPRCEACGMEMEFKDYNGWTIHGLEGDSRLERAYYVCPECEGQTLFPPGPQTAAATGPLE